MGDWTAPLSGFRVVFVGPEGSVFPAEASRKLRDRGISAEIVSWSPQLRHYGVFDQFVRHLEWRLSNVWKQRFQSRTGLDEPVGWRFVDNLMRAKELAKRVNACAPDMVIAHETHTSGLCLRYCTSPIRAVQVWGGDIYWYSESSPIQSFLVRTVLRQADLILTSSRASIDRMAKRFAVPTGKVKVVSGDVRVDEFAPLTAEARSNARARFGISDQDIVISNCRRFQKQWGGAAFIQAAFALVRQAPGLKFFLVTGIDGDTSTFFRDSIEQIRQLGLESHFVVLDRKLSLAEWKEIMALSDIFVSSMGEGDLLSASVLQAAACGGIPVMSDLPQFREMLDLGFQGLLADPGRVDHLTQVINEAIKMLPIRNSVYERNKKWLLTSVQNEDYADQVINILESFRPVRGSR